MPWSIEGMFLPPSEWGVMNSYERLLLLSFCDLCQGKNRRRAVKTRIGTIQSSAGCGQPAMLLAKPPALSSRDGREALGWRKIESFRKQVFTAGQGALPSQALVGCRLGLLCGFLFLENHNPAQMTRIVRIETFFQSCIEAHELACKDISGQMRQWRQVRIQLDQKV